MTVRETILTVVEIYGSAVILIFIILLATLLLVKVIDNLNDKH